MKTQRHWPRRFCPGATSDQAPDFDSLHSESTVRVSIDRGFNAACCSPQQGMTYHNIVGSVNSVALKLCCRVAVKLSHSNSSN